MKVIMKSGLLLATLRGGSRAAFLDAKLPILRTVNVKVVNGHLSIHGTDLDNHTVERSGELSGSSGSCHVEPRVLLEVLESLDKDSSVTLDLEDFRLTLTHESGSLTVPARNMEGDSLPPWPLAKQEVFTIMGGHLLAALDELSSYMSEDESWYVLNGVLFHKDVGGVQLTATDGRRLAYIFVTADLVDIKCEDFILRRDGVKILREVLVRDKRASVKVEVTDGSLASFEVGMAKLACKVIQGNYPTWRQVVPTPDTVAGFSCLRSELKRAVEAVRPVVTEKSRAVKVLVDGSAVSLVSDKGEAIATATMKVIRAFGSGAVFIDCRYLQDVATGSEVEVEVGLRSGSEPVTFKYCDIGTQVIVMPMRD